MTRKILVPTDFSIESLIVLRTYFQENLTTADNYEITLLHGYSTPSDSIRELLFFSKSKVLNDLKLDKYLEAMEILKSKFDTQIKNITIDLFSGYTLSAFENYLTGNQIEEIVTCDRFKFKPICKRSFDLNKIILKSKLKTPVKNLNWSNENSTKWETEDLSVLFNAVS